MKEILTNKSALVGDCRTVSTNCRLVRKGRYIMMNRKTKRIVSMAIVIVLILAMIVPSLIYAFS